MKKAFLTLLFGFSALLTYAQTSIKGTVTDATNTPIPGASVRVLGTSSGTATDFDGNFALETSAELPITLLVSSVGFKEQKVNITGNTSSLSIQLQEGTELDEVVVSASRTPERIFESPVTVERFGIQEIKNTASADFYDGLENLKGVDINTNSLTFKSINTRGFATFANNRFMQLVDGMDNSAPALNFPLGNLLGMTQTDVQSVEILPGASSALYGANAFNGILLMRSKNPFEFPGISAYAKQGVTVQDAAGTNSFTDVGARLAHKVSDNFAFKANIGYLKGTDWMANNTTAKAGTDATRAGLNYDGINVYGDEVATDIGALHPSIPSGTVVSRTGFAERDLTNNNAESLKADWGMYIRPFADDLEISYQGKYGTGSTIYQGANRYAIKDFTMSQHKLEVRNDNFFVRGYMTEDNAGDSYDMVFTGINMNRYFKSDEAWFGDYVASFLGAVNPANIGNHDEARAYAQSGIPEPGSSEFVEAFNQVTSDPSVLTGSKFQDNSKFYHGDFNYNFGHLYDGAEIQVGGSYRQYALNSGGTIYTDVDGEIMYSEFGLYTQVQKKLLDDRLKLTGSLRYDKSELFDGFFSPRVSIGYSLGENKDHNIRASFQTGFRNPTTQDLYIGLDVGRAILIGGANNNPERYTRSYNLSDLGSAIAQAPTGTIELDATGAYNNSYTATSVGEFAALAATGDFTSAIGALEVANSDFAKPEQVTSFEIGYRGKINKVIVDFSAYYNQYQDFLSTETVVATHYGTAGDNSDVFTVPNVGSPLDGATLPKTALAIINEDFQAFRTYTNSDADVSSYGASIALGAKVFGGYDFDMNYTYSKLDFDREANPDFATNFNTPEHKFKATFGHKEVIDNLGFNIAYRWSDSYLWEASFGDGMIPSFSVLDAQVSYTIPKMLSTLKVGGTNLLGDEYYTAFGTGYIGSMFYVSWTINDL